MLVLDGMMRKKARDSSGYYTTRMDLVLIPVSSQDELIINSSPCLPSAETAVSAVAALSASFRLGKKNQFCLQPKNAGFYFLHGYVRAE
jgi:hypothetical protein